MGEPESILTLRAACNRGTLFGLIVEGQWKILMDEPNQSLINELLLQLWEDTVLELTAIWALVITEFYDCQGCGAVPKNWLFF